MNKEDLKKIDAARRRFDAISAEARQLIYQRVLRHYQKNPASPWSGAPLRDLERTIRQFYLDLGVKYDGAFRDTLPPLMQTFYDRAVEEMKSAGVRRAILGKPDSGRVKYFLDSAFEQVAMKTQNMSFQHIRELRRITADVTRQMSIAGATRREVSKALLDRALTIPGFEFIDKSGSKWPLKSYFNTLARTELMNAGRASYDDKCAKEGFDVMKLSTSGMSCPKCAAFEGRLFSLTGATDSLPSKDDLLAAGVFHPNCTHSYSLVPDFIRERDFDADGKKNRTHDFRDYSTANPQELNKLKDQYRERILATCTNGERNAISGYSMDDYVVVNAYHRNSLELQAKEKSRAVSISDKISSALDKVRCMEDIKVFRGTNSAKSVFPGMKTGKTLEDCVKELVASGEPVVLNGFTSTSVLRKSADDFSRGVQFEINVPKGTRAAFIESESQVRGEMEMLLDRETKVRIIGYREYFDEEKSRLIKFVMMEVI